LLNRIVAHASFETATTPTRCLFAFDDEERDSWRERGGTIHERFENVGLRFLLVYLADRRFHDGHVARGLRTGRLRSCQLDATLVSSVQMFLDGGDHAALHLHIRLALKESRKRLVE
jgi:hypothetical protein